MYEELLRQEGGIQEVIVVMMIIEGCVGIGDLLKEEDI